MSHRNLEYISRKAPNKILIKHAPIEIAIYCIVFCCQFFLKQNIRLRSRVIAQHNTIIKLILLLCCSNLTKNTKAPIHKIPKIPKNFAKSFLFDNFCFNDEYIKLFLIFPSTLLFSTFGSLKPNQISCYD